MSRRDPLYQWTHEVTTAFPHLSKPGRTTAFAERARVPYHGS